MWRLFDRPRKALAHKWSTGMQPWQKGWHQTFSSGETPVSIHSLAVYIHEQINGTHADIFRQLYERLDTLEIPNNGSKTLISFDTACVIVEDIGAHADDLKLFLAEDELLEKSVGFPELQDHGPDSRFVTSSPSSSCIVWLEGDVLQSVADS